MFVIFLGPQTNHWVSPSSSVRAETMLWLVWPQERVDWRKDVWERLPTEDVIVNICSATTDQSEPAVAEWLVKVGQSFSYDDWSKLASLKKKSPYISTESIERIWCNSNTTVGEVDLPRISSSPLMCAIKDKHLNLLSWQTPVIFSLRFLFRCQDKNRWNRWKKNKVVGCF